MQPRASIDNERAPLLARHRRYPGHNACDAGSTRIELFQERQEEI